MKLAVTKAFRKKGILLRPHDRYLVKGKVAILIANQTTEKRYLVLRGGN